jgi:hypothetical protein
MSTTTPIESASRAVSAAQVALEAAQVALATAEAARVSPAASATMLDVGEAAADPHHRPPTPMSGTLVHDPAPILVVGLFALLLACAPWRTTMRTAASVYHICRWQPNL